MGFGSPAINSGDPESRKDPDGSRADMGALPARLFLHAAEAKLTAKPKLGWKFSHWSEGSTNPVWVAMQSNVEMVANFVETEDTDGDGVKDADELLMGSDPWDSDSVLPPDGAPVAYVNDEPHLSGSIILADLAKIEFRTGFAGGSIFYTIDGKDALSFGDVYSTPFSVSHRTF